MKISVAANFEEGYLERLAKHKEVVNVYGKLPADFIGGGYETSKLPDVSVEKLESYIRKANNLGISFSYVINATVMNNDEYTKAGIKKLHELLSFLDTQNLESVTVSNVYLIHYIRKNFPNLPIKISANLMIDTVEKARHFESLGAKIIVLDPMLVNRNMKMLKAIRRAVSCELELIVNNNCFTKCPYLSYHQSYLSFNSRTVNESDHTPFDFCYTTCSRLRVLDPGYWVKADWIRPEDMPAYENIGYDRIKIIDRSTPADVLVKRVEAYANRSYDGNLLDLILHYGYKDTITPQEYLDNIYIDNKKLDGFFEKSFFRADCSHLNCNVDCTKCFDHATEAMSINEEWRQKMIEKKNHEYEQQLVEI
jgi:collagenase-like PrtC family protease